MNKVVRHIVTKQLIMVLALCRLRFQKDSISDNDTLIPEIREEDTVNGRVWFVINFTTHRYNGRVSIRLIKHAFEDDFDYIKGLKMCQFYGVNGKHIGDLIPKGLRNNDKQQIPTTAEDNFVFENEVMTATAIQERIGKPIVLRKYGDESILCPYCRDRHENGIGSGHRGSHCSKHNRREKRSVTINGKVFTYHDGYTIVDY
jgi:hypothetical protein